MVSVLMALTVHKKRDRHSLGHWVGSVSLGKGSAFWKPGAGLCAGCQGLLDPVMLHWNPAGWGGISRTKEGTVGNRTLWAELMESEQLQR